jgi:hypothetical protein
MLVACRLAGLSALGATMAHRCAKGQLGAWSLASPVRLTTIFSALAEWLSALTEERAKARWRRLVD